MDELAPENDPVWGEKEMLDRNEEEDETVNNLQRENHIRALRRAISDAQKELSVLENMPNEPLQDNVLLTVKFSPGFNKVYKYAATRIVSNTGQQLWYLTGKHPIAAYEWSDMISHFERKGTIVQIWTLLKDRVIYAS